MAQDSILIIGAGSWGCSISLELARRGYTGITVLDGKDFLSSTSEGTDRNMIAEEAPSSPSPSPQNTLHTLSLQKWRTDPLFSPFYHPTPLTTAQPRPSASPSLHESPPNTSAGWINTRSLVPALRAAALTLGVRFLCGPQHSVTRLIYSTTSASLSGAVTANNATHAGAKVIVAAGAYSALLLDFCGQIVPRAHAVAWVSLARGEAARARARARGIVVHADTESKEAQAQIVDLVHPGYINPVPNTSTYVYDSVPCAKAQIPLEAEARLRARLEGALPHLAARPFSRARLVWEADGAVVIDRHPGLGNLVVAVGGGAEVCPAIGGLVADVVDGGEGVGGMRWRAEECEGRDIWEGPRGRCEDIRDVKGWTRIGE